MSASDALIGRMLSEVESAYISLHTADPEETGASEVAGGQYRRMPPPRWERNGETATNAGDVLFEGLPRASLSHVGFWSAATGGSFLCARQIGGVRQAQAGDGLRIRAGEIVLLQTMVEE